MRAVCVRWCLAAVPLVVVVHASACTQVPAPPREFALRGQILAVVSPTELLIKHDDIKGFMPAMTMAYQVRDPQLAQGRAPGDLIEATLAVSDTSAWLTRIEKTGSAPVVDPVAAASPAASVAVLNEGDRVPDTSLVDERGQPLSLTRFGGSAVAITFIYTRCPLPEYCPLLDRRFANVQRLVKEDPMLANRVRLVSVSFDPDADSPAVLRAHATKLGADPQLWHFATAPRDVVDRFAAAFGVSVIREADKTITHNVRTAVVDPDGKVLAIRDGMEWTPEQIATELRRALSAK